MKKKKLILRIIMGVLAALMVVSIIYGAVASISLSAEEYSSIEVKTFETGSLDTAITEVLGDSSADSVKSIKIQDGTLNAKDIESLASFDNCGLIDLKNCTIENKIIPEYAFSNLHGNLKTIYLPKDIVSVDRLAFYECPHLENVYFQEGLKQIGEQAFKGCPELKAVYLPSSVERINAEAFMKCKNLERISAGNNKMAFPKSLRMIGKSAFSECHQLNYPIFPENMSLIEEYVFLDCFSLDNALFLGKTAPTLKEDVFPTDMTVNYTENAEGYDKWVMYKLHEDKAETTVTTEKPVSASQITLKEDPDVTDNELTGAPSEEVTDNTAVTDVSTEKVTETATAETSTVTEEIKETTEIAEEVSGEAEKMPTYKIVITILVSIVVVFIISKLLLGIFNRVDDGPQEKKNQNDKNSENK